MAEYRGSFNNTKPKPVPARKHRIVDYNAHEDHVTCTCGFDGTAQDFEGHNVSNIDAYHHKTRGSTFTNLLRDIKHARFDYYNQASTGYYRPEEDGYFLGDRVPPAWNGKDDD
jgi:hypothetical protein